MKYCFGIDVGGTTIKAGLFDEEGKLLENWAFATICGDNGRHIYDDVAENVLTKCKNFGITLSDVLGVGIDMPGPVYEDGKLGLCNNLGVLGGYPAEELSRRLSGKKAAVLNDANAAAMGEYWFGAGKNYYSACMVTLGTGVGGGLIMNGELMTGSHGAAGEIGHIRVADGEKESCNCGAKGCCEFYASATGIVRVAKRLAASGDPMKPLDPEKPFLYPDSLIAKPGASLTAKDVCDLARSGDELAGKAISFSMEKLAVALAAVTCIMDPEVFIIGGGVSKAFDVLEPLITEKIADLTPVVRDRKRNVVPALLGNDAGIYGAASVILKG